MIDVDELGRSRGGLPRARVSLPATYPRKRGPRAWHTGVRQTAQRLGDRGRTSSKGNTASPAVGAQNESARKDDDNVDSRPSNY